jgi:large subunit ribosomal protein L21e
MSNKKPVRTRGKLQFSRYFQKFNEGDKATVVSEPAVPKNFPKRLQGRTGVIVGKKGRVYAVKINDQKEEKEFLIEPVHLKKVLIK